MIKSDLEIIWFWHNRGRIILVSDTIVSCVEDVIKDVFLHLPDLRMAVIPTFHVTVILKSLVSILLSYEIEELRQTNATNRVN